jgi:AcrR family transcriptional regulator
MIVDAALEAIDRDGMESLSMRGLATSLSVYPQTLYWHVGNKAQLVALLFQEVLEQVELPDPETTPWTEWLFEMASEVRRAMSSQARLAAHFVGQIQVVSPSLRITEATLRSLTVGGFRGHELVTVYNTVMGAVFGWISTEFSADPPDADARWREEFEQRLRETDDAALPTIKANVELLANRAFMLRWSSGESTNMHDSFELMVRSLISGLVATRPG